MPFDCPEALCRVYLKLFLGFPVSRHPGTEVQRPRTVSAQIGHSSLYLTTILNAKGVKRKFRFIECGLEAPLRNDLIPPLILSRQVRRYDFRNALPAKSR
jgi:hypothetical protein